MAGSHTLVFRVRPKTRLASALKDATQALKELGIPHQFSSNDINSYGERVLYFHIPRASEQLYIVSRDKLGILVRQRILSSYLVKW